MQYFAGLAGNNDFAQGRTIRTRTTNDFRTKMFARPLAQPDRSLHRSFGTPSRNNRCLPKLSMGSKGRSIPYVPQRSGEPCTCIGASELKHAAVCELTCEKQHDSAEARFGNPMTQSFTYSSFRARRRMIGHRSPPRPPGITSMRNRRRHAQIHVLNTRSWYELTCC